MRYLKSYPLYYGYVHFYKGRSLLRSWPAHACLLIIPVTINAKKKLIPVASLQHIALQPLKKNSLCNIVARFVYFCVVSVKYNNRFRQITAVFFLLILSAVFIIKVSHSHPSPTAVRQKVSVGKKDFSTVWYKTFSGTKCLICEYEVTKDVDGSYASFQISHPFNFGLIIAIEFNYDLTKINTLFENRGPPTAWPHCLFLFIKLLQ